MDHKRQILNTEIYEIGKVSRCFGYASDENFDTLEAADDFRKNTIRSFLIFGLITTAKTVIEFILHKFYSNSVLNEESNLVYAALDIFEVLVTMYVLYSMFMFCSCLGQGLIYEYQPMLKFTLISAMAVVIVCQDFIINCFAGRLVPQFNELTYS